MGVAPIAETKLAERDIRPPSTRFATPDSEVGLACRLALGRYLQQRQLGNLQLISDLLCESPGKFRGRSTIEDWSQLRALLQDTVVLDPACGEGNFLLGMLELLDSLEGRLEALSGARNDGQTRRRRILEQHLYGVEVDEQAVSQCRHRLVQAVKSGAEDFQPVQDRPRLNIFLADSLVEGPDFSWSSSLPEICRRGGFDLAIGNPPYVRHERIVDPLGRLPKEAYRRRVMAQLLSRLPRAYNPADKHEVSRPSGRSDLSLLFILHALSLLRPGGALSFVVPTALFQSGYGETLRTAMQEMDRDGQIVESARRRSFACAGINTAILVVGDRESAGSHGSLVHVQMPDIPTGARSSAVAANDSRAEEASASRLSRQLLARLADHVTPLGSLGHVRYSLKSGINRFFYPDRSTVTRFEIAEFCRPVLRSPRTVKRICAGPDDVNTVVFDCESSYEELMSGGHHGAVSYIQWGSQQRTAAGVPWPSVASVRGRRRWYSLPHLQPADIICPRFFDRRFFFVAPERPMLEDQTFYGLVLAARDISARSLVAALLNSSLSYLWVETHGRTGLGEGVRQYALCDMAALPAISPRSLPVHGRKILAAELEPLLYRPIMSIDREIKQADRLALDAALGDLLGIPLAATYEVRSRLVELVSRRMEKAHSF